MKHAFLGVLPLTLAVLASLVGCSASTPDTSAPVAQDDDLGLKTDVVQSTNTDGLWTAEAIVPPQDGIGGIQGAAQFWGPAGKTRKMGVCILQVSNIPCTIPAGTAAQKQASINTQCASLYTATGGQRYCIQPNYETQSYCAVRPGPQTSFCAGSPGISGNPPVAPGTYYTPNFGAGWGMQYVSDACFEGCGVTDPAVSSAAVGYCYVNAPNGDQCTDSNCDGVADQCMSSDGYWYFPGPGGAS